MGTRIREGKEVSRVATEKLAVAQFRHVTARETENGTPAPQIHSHNVLLNMTQDDAGNWRSLDARDLYRLQKHIGAVYHMELAAELRRLGYSVTIAPDTTFEIDGVPDDVQRAFSPRSAQIEAALAARGQTRANASAAEKNAVALATRAPKRSVDPATLAGTWRAQADALGFDAAERRAMVVAAEARALARPNLGTIQRMAEADKAVSFATAKPPSPRRSGDRPMAGPRGSAKRPSSCFSPLPPSPASRAMPAPPRPPPSSRPSPTPRAGRR